MGRGHGGHRISLADTTQFDRISLGDPYAHMDVEVLGERRFLPAIGIAADLKIPLADVNRGFGTGKWDYGGGILLTKSTGTYYLFADLSYWILGDLPELDFRNPVVYSIGWGRAFANGAYGVLTSFSGSTSSITGVDPPAQISAGFNYRMKSGRSVNGSIAVRLSESVPDMAVILGWRLPL
jgi:hypothetical protein